MNQKMSPFAQISGFGGGKRDGEGSVTKNLKYKPQANGNIKNLKGTNLRFQTRHYNKWRPVKVDHSSDFDRLQFWAGLVRKHRKLHFIFFYPAV